MSDRLGGRILDASLSHWRNGLPHEQITKKSFPPKCKNLKIAPIHPFIPHHCWSPKIVSVFCLVCLAICTPVLKSDPVLALGQLILPSPTFSSRAEEGDDYMTQRFVKSSLFSTEEGTNSA